MNEQTTQLIEKLAAKLGTTAEYLWKVLIQQAPIEATQELVRLVVVIIIFAICMRTIFKNGKPSQWGDHDFNAAAGKVLVGIVVGAGALIVFFAGVSMNTIITGFVNPEYWALQQVLNLR